MKCNGRISLTLATVAALFCAAASPKAAAQQVTGTPGSPSATTSIDGKQIPPPPPKFGGVINGPRQWSELDRKTVEEMVARARD
jgi:hypothetical protein